MTDLVSEPLASRPAAATALAELLRSGALGARLITAARHGAGREHGGDPGSGSGTPHAAEELAPGARRVNR